MSSIDLPPDERGAWARFKEMQFQTKPRPPPASLSFAGQTAVITGGYIGIGLACAKDMLAHQLSHLILAVRTVDKGEVIAKQLRQQYPKAKIEVWPLEMLSYDSIRAFVTRCESLSRLDIAILNAGVGGGTFTINPSTGHEEGIQVNYLSTALLALLLLPVLKRSTQSNGGTPARLTMVASATAFRCAFANRDAKPLLPSFDKHEGAWGLGEASERYSVSKLLLMMFTLTLGQHVSSSDVIINCVEPGFTSGTGLQRHVKGVLLRTVVLMMRIIQTTPEVAAYTYLDAVAMKGRESHGSFLMCYRNFP